MLNLIYDKGTKQSDLGIPSFAWNFKTQKTTEFVGFKYYTKHVGSLPIYLRPRFFFKVIYIFKLFQNIINCENIVT